MTHEVRFASAAVRQLRRLPEGVAAAVVEFATTALPENPARLSKPLTGEFDHLRSARRGDYRVLVLVDDEAGVITVVRVAHRATAYRPPAP